MKTNLQYLANRLKELSSYPGIISAGGGGLLIENFDAFSTEWFFCLASIIGGLITTLTRDPRSPA